jgi:lysozyme
VETITGRTPVIYVDPSFWNALGNPQGFERYPLFIAEYGAACPSVPPPWTTWTFWQKNTGSVAGVSTTQGDIDEFNGSAAALNGFSEAP